MEFDRLTVIPKVSTGLSATYEGTGADLINHVWLEITVDGTWNILSLSW